MLLAECRAPKISLPELSKTKENPRTRIAKGTHFPTARISDLRQRAYGGFRFLILPSRASIVEIQPLPIIDAVVQQVSRQRSALVYLDPCDPLRFCNEPIRAGHENFIQESCVRVGAFQADGNTKCNNEHFCMSSGIIWISNANRGHLVEPTPDGRCIYISCVTSAKLWKRVLDSTRPCRGGNLIDAWS